jgi:hypothetical protein
MALSVTFLRGPHRTSNFFHRLIYYIEIICYYNIIKSYSVKAFFYQPRKSIYDRPAHFLCRYAVTVSDLRAGLTIRIKPVIEQSKSW